MVQCPIPVHTACAGVELTHKTVGNKTCPAITLSLCIDIPVEELIGVLSNFQQGFRGPEPPNPEASQFQGGPTCARPQGQQLSQVGQPPCPPRFPLGHGPWEQLPAPPSFNRVKVSNMVKRIKAQDLQKVFSRYVGPVCECSLREDVATITFWNSEHAYVAMEKYDGGTLEMSTDKSKGADGIFLFAKDANFRETMENRLGPLGQCQLRRGEGWITLFRRNMAEQLKREDALNQIDFKGTIITIDLDKGSLPGGPMGPLSHSCGASLEL
eukprot:s779_g25.t1